MIKNERQYKITKAAARNFEMALSESKKLTTDTTDELALISLRALASQLEEPKS